MSRSDNSCNLLIKPKESDLVDVNKLLENLGFIILVSLASCALLLSSTSQPIADHLFSNAWNETRDLKVAFVGNSIQYYNDFPRLMEAISGYHITQNSCLRGGATLSTILTRGNGMKTKFKSSNAKTESGGYDIGAPNVYDLLVGDYSDDWDYIVLNDRTYNPAINKTLQEGMKALKETYTPMLKEIGAVPILLANHATRTDHNRTKTFGGFKNYTKVILEGYYAYKDFLDGLLPENQTARVAPVGQAFLQVYEENYDLWYRLYHTDGLHPSPHGTYLQAIVTYCTMNGRPPPTQYALPNYPSNLFDRARIMQPYGQDPLDRPTLSEAKYLYGVATQVTLGS